MFKKIAYSLIKVSIGFILLAIGFSYYVNNHAVKNIAELECATQPTSFIQIEQYAPITKLWGRESDGNIKLTFADGTKRYFRNINILGYGNQRVALILGDGYWDRYVFGSQKLYYNSTAYDCF